MTSEHESARNHPEPMQNLIDLIISIVKLREAGLEAHIIANIIQSHYGLDRTEAFVTIGQVEAGLIKYTKLKAEDYQNFTESPEITNPNLPNLD